MALAGGVAVFLLGDLCFRLSLGIGPKRYRALGAAAVLATVPLGRAAAAAQLLGLAVVMVLMLVAEEDAGAVSAGPPFLDGSGSPIDACLPGG